MTHGQGHKANDVFAPRGAWQSGVSADFFALGYDAFGSLLPGRNYSPSSYNYGFNGQLKDDEIYNAPGTSYTAEFWQYDPRTGRRWNLDPVFKPWQSSYATFSDNPIARIDPKGDDDFFNADGTFSHRTKTGHNIIIKTADGDVKFSAMRTNDLHNRQVMANVVGYYARQVGIDGTVGIRNHRSKNAREDGAMAFTLGNDIWVNARGGGVHSALDDYRNMKSALVHERIHKERGEGFENPDANPAFESYRHAKVYLAQMQDPTFADAQFKSGMIGSVVNYLNKAVGEMREDYDPATEMSGLIADFNKLSDVTGYKLHMTVTGVGNNPDSYTYKVSATPVTPPKTKKQ